MPNVHASIAKAPTTTSQAVNPPSGYSYATFSPSGVFSTPSGSRLGELGAGETFVTMFSRFIGLVVERVMSRDSPMSIFILFVLLSP